MGVRYLSFQKFGEDGWSGLKIYRWLKDEIKFTTKNGKPFMLSNIYLLLRNSFYTGTYEYPRKSGRWYIGKHTPIITKELYQKVQKRLENGKANKSYTQEFAFTKLTTCAYFGSGITAGEKFGHLKDGTVNRYIYTIAAAKRKTSIARIYKEEVLVTELLRILDKVSLNELRMRAKIKQEMDRYNSFRSHVLNLSLDEQKKQMDIESKHYAQYILQKGTIQEKRDLVACPKSKLVFKDKRLELTN